MAASNTRHRGPSRRAVLLTGAAASATVILPHLGIVQTQPDLKAPKGMTTLTTSDGIEIFYKGEMMDP